MALEPEQQTKTPRWGFRTALRWTTGWAAFAGWLALLILGGAGSPWDEALYRALYAGDNDLLARNAGFLTMLGSWRILIPLTVAATVLLAFQRRMRAALLLVMIFGGRLLVEIQKVLVDRDRPGVSPHLEAVHSNSFPSGHATNAMITYLGIAMLLPVRHRMRAVAIGIGLAVALQVGWSRVALGVHWPSDVLGGWAFATFWIILCMRLAHARPEAEPGGAPDWRGTHPRPKPFFPRRRRKMSEDNKRADSARAHDDSEIIDRAEEAPDFGGVSGGNVQRDVGSRAEVEHEVEGKPGVTRVTAKDKPPEADLPRYNPGNRKLNP